jgi:HNH endonuclease
MASQTASSPKIPCICHECGDTFFVHPYRVPTARCCSRGCNGRFQGRKRRGHPAPRKSSPVELFWARVLKGEPDACWLWQGPKDKDGYGHFQLRGKKTSAHRVAYLLTHGPIPSDQNVCHNCPGGDNPACCNPSHLWPGTQHQNVQDSIRKGRRHLPSNTKLTVADLPEIQRLYDPYRYGQVRLAKRFGVTQCTMQRFLVRHNLAPGRGPRLPETR